jgi:hypothetical protein
VEDTTFTLGECALLVSEVFNTANYRLLTPTKIQQSGTNACLFCW